MRRKTLAVIILALTVLMGGCADNVAITKASTEVKLRKTEIAYPWFYEKGVGYEGDLSAIAEKVKTGNSDAITEVITTLHQLIQAYHPDKVGFSFSLRTYPYAFAMDLVGNKKAEVLSWKEILENLGIEDVPGVVQLVNLLPSSEQAVKVRYVKNSLESLCLAYRKFMVDADNLWYLNKKEYKVSFNREKDMINFSLYRRAILPLIGGDFSPEDKRISAFNPNIWDFEKLINAKYKGLIYYSEFD